MVLRQRYGEPKFHVLHTSFSGLAPRMKFTGKVEVDFRYSSILQIAGRKSGFSSVQNAGAQRQKSKKPTLLSTAFPCAVFVRLQPRVGPCTTTVCGFHLFVMTKKDSP